MAGKKTTEFMTTIEKLCNEFKGMLNSCQNVQDKWTKAAVAIMKLPSKDRTPSQEHDWNVWQKREAEAWKNFQMVVNGDIQRKRKEIEKKMDELRRHLKSQFLPTPTGKKFIKTWTGILAKWEHGLYF